MSGDELPAVASATVLAEAPSNIKPAPIFTVEYEEEAEEEQEAVSEVDALGEGLEPKPDAAVNEQTNGDIVVSDALDVGGKQSVSEGVTEVVQLEQRQGKIGIIVTAYVGIDLRSSTSSISTHDILSCRFRRIS